MVSPVLWCVDLHLAWSYEELVQQDPKPPKYLNFWGLDMYKCHDFWKFHAGEVMDAVWTEKVKMQLNMR